jgi:hypothetical protein
MFEVGCKGVKDGAVHELQNPKQLDCGFEI